ncbi:Trp biosynthesis-associated membrane protein [Brachybacterium sp. EF45031]|uniref:Trp biosynthesis-associated membrane protein n=1 Tax=Brachybacterium sillae TaxID=2810536 RepID=UPI00217ECB51|nr:Trp biosynthesis-associated membrane protein [Brachybacterium sillae]MCS6710557.1 Trp biosynthesis-associated membrane protein [Brachybacterium sillae]
MLSRRALVLTELAVSVLLLGLSRATWVRALGSTLAGARTEVEVIGSAAAPAVVALGVVGAAAALATTLSSPRVRWVTGPVTALAGAGIVAASALVLADPAQAAVAGVADATGVRGAQIEASATFWPIVALVLGGLLAALGVLTLVAGRGWNTRRTRSRYQRADAAGAVPPPDDELDHAGGPAATATTATGVAPVGGPSGSEASDDPAGDWDALSRGEDPTA